MGVWGSGLYAGDFAADLRSAIGAVARLPFDADRLVQILGDFEPAAASNPEDEDHTTFWLVLADQFAKRGLVCPRVTETALQIIDQGADLALLTRLGMNAAGLKKRQQMLTELRRRITEATPSAKPRAVLKKPQPLLMDIGDVIIYPTADGDTINPYYPLNHPMISDWQPDGWSAALIVDAGRTFDFLAWYRPLTLTTALTEKPDLARLRSLSPWVLRHPGTCSKAHFSRLGLEKLGRLTVDRAKLLGFFPWILPGNVQAINDISIVGDLEVGPKKQPRLFIRFRGDKESRSLTVPSLEDILS